MESPEPSVPTILIADDDALIRLVLERALRSQGYTVTVASSRADSFTAYVDSSFDLVILDAHMPGPTLADSLSLMGRTRQLPQTIIMSGDLERPAWLPAAQSYISKPFDLSEFLDVVALHLAREKPATQGEESH